MKTILLFLFLPMTVWSQTVGIRGISMAKELKNGVRPVFVEVSVDNDATNPVKMDTHLFYLVSSPTSQHFPALVPAGVAGLIVLSPGEKTAQKLTFEVAGDAQVESMTLCFHSPEDKSWSDYLEIPFTWPAAVKAPMWHPDSPDQTSDAMAYVTLKDASKPPRLLHAPLPLLPPVNGRQRLIDAGGLMKSVVSLVVDREGKPQQLWIAKPAGFGFDQEALKTVKKYRFEPAKGPGGAPIAVRINVDCVFRSY